MNGYIAFYNGKQTEVHATTSYNAKLRAIKIMNVRKSQHHMVTVVLCEKDGVQVVHSPAVI